MNFIFSFQEQDNECISTTYNPKNVIDYFPKTLKIDDFILLNKENIYSSMNLCKNYGKVFLYTTNYFYKKIKKYIPNDIKIEILELDINKTVWSQTKFFSILENIKKYNQPFFHLDFDFFLLENLFYNMPEIVVTGQEYYEKNNYEYFNGYFGYGTHYSDFFKFFENENIVDLKELNCGYAYNCSIVGGKNLNLFIKWCEKSIDLSKKYKNITLPKELNYNKLCSIIEQSHLAKLCYESNIDVFKLSDLKQNDIFKKEKFIHSKFYGPELYYNQQTDPNFIYRLYNLRFKYLEGINK